MKCSLLIIAASPESTELQLFDACCSVFEKSAYPAPRRAGLSRLKSSPASERLPMLAPWMYHPPGHPNPSIAMSRLFQPRGGANHVGEASTVGSCKTAL